MMCLPCAFRRPKVGCAKCAAANPAPLHVRVSSFISTVAAEQKKEREAAAEKFRSDFQPTSLKGLGIRRTRRAKEVARAI